jgi:hypothetical protein
MSQQTRRQVNLDLLGDLFKTYLAHTLDPETHRVIPHSPESISDTCAAFISHVKQCGCRSHTEVTN